MDEQTQRTLLNLVFSRKKIKVGHELKTSRVPRGHKETVLLYVGQQGRFDYLREHGITAKDIEAFSSSHGTGTERE